jgi:hypothetical protein
VAPTHLTYLAILQEIAALGRKQINLIPHSAEKGRALENLVSNVLTQLLPKRFSLGTGFLVNADGAISNQQDIIIYDHVFNAPLLTHAVGIFPCECVYATIEVKTTLTNRGLSDTLKSIARLRHIARRKSYIAPNHSDMGSFLSIELDLAPRTYVIAARKTGLGSTMQKTQAKIEGLSGQQRSHLHGLCILEQDWFFAQKPHTHPASVTAIKGNSLANLYRAIIEQTASYPIYPGELGRYFTG